MKPMPNSQPPATPAPLSHAIQLSPGAVRVPPAPLAMPDALGLLKALRRRLIPAISLGLLAAAVVAVGAYYLVPPAKYTARAMLFVATDQPKILLKTSDNQSDYGTYQRTQIALLRSRLVLNTALKQPEVARLDVVKNQVDPVEWLEKELQVDFANGSEILRVSMNGIDARVPAVLVNAVVQAYLDEIVNVELKQRRERADMLKAAWIRYQDYLRGKRDEIKKLMAVAGSDDQQTRAILQRSGAERLATAEAELARARSELRQLRVELEVLERAEGPAGSDVPSAAVEELIAGDERVQHLIELSQQAQRHYHDAYRVTKIPTDPVLMKHRRDYEAAQAALAERRRKLAPIKAEQLRQEGLVGNPRTVTLRERIEILSGLEQMYADDVDRLSEQGRSTSQASIDLFSIQEEIAYADDVAKKIGAEVETLNLELQAPPRVTLRERAEVPRTKDEMRQAKAAGMAGLGAFAAVLAGVSFLEFRIRRVDSADEVVRSLGLRLVGTLPAMPPTRRRTGSAGARDQAWQSLMVESVDTARTVLLHASQTESIRAVMVASALPGEGKTSLSCHLAASLARAGRRTLLVDCDLRRPSAHRLFDLPCEPGLCEVLRGEVGLDAAIWPTGADGLSLLPAGRCDAEALAALARDDLAALFERLKGQFDFLVVDSSPVLPVADALLVAQHVDAVLYAVLRDVSRLPKLQAAHERLSALGVRSLGAVMAGAQAESYGHQYYYTAFRSGEHA